MKKFIKIVSVVTALALSCGMLASCGKATDKDEQGRTIVSVGNWPSKEGASLDAATERKAKFEAVNTDVVIEPDAWTFERKTFYAKAAGGQLPTFYHAGYTEIPEIFASEYSADLTDALKKRGFDEKFNSDVLEIISDDKGNIKAVPHTAFVLGLGFHTELMEAAGLMEADGTPKQPKDWYEVAEFAVKIKEATGKAGFIFPTANHVGGWIFSSLAWSFGVDFMEQDKDGKWHATFDTAEAAEALQYIKDLKWKYDVLPNNTLIDATEYFKTYATGNAGMLVFHGDLPAQVSRYNMNPEHVGMMAMPAGPKRNVTLLGGGAWFVEDNATKDQIDAAVRWYEVEHNFNLTEELKTSIEKRTQIALDANALVGIKGMSIWSGDSEALAWEHKYIDEHANANTNHVKLYNEFCANCPAEIQAEEPVCCQELYGILDDCIQEVLSNKDADCAQLLKKANADFQTNYLDNLTY